MRVSGLGWVEANSGGFWPPLSWPMRCHSGTASRGSKQAAAASISPTSSAWVSWPRAYGRADVTP